MSSAHSLYDGRVFAHGQVEEWHQLGASLEEALRLGQHHNVTLIAQLLEMLQGDGVDNASVQQFPSF